MPAKKQPAPAEPVPHAAPHAGRVTVILSNAQRTSAGQHEPGTRVTLPAAEAAALMAAGHAVRASTGRPS